MYIPFKGYDDKILNGQGDNQNNQIKKSREVGTELCKFYLIGECSKGDNCKFRHEKNPDPDEIPECPYGQHCYKKNCGCPFKHSAKVITDCPNYENGYCKFGNKCQNIHNKKELCINYLLGYCPLGPNCKLIHIKSMVPPEQDDVSFLTKDMNKFKETVQKEYEKNVINN